MVVDLVKELACFALEVRPVRELWLVFTRPVRNQEAFEVDVPGLLAPTPEGQSSRSTSSIEAGAAVRKSVSRATTFDPSGTS